MTRTAAKNARTRHGGKPGHHSCLVSWEKTSHTAFTTVARVTAARSRSVWYAPPTGWVTVLAGLLAHGSVPERPAFPVSQWLRWTTDSPLTVAGAATMTACYGRSVFPLASPARTGEPTPGHHFFCVLPRQGRENKERRRVADAPHSCALTHATGPPGEWFPTRPGEPARSLQCQPTQLVVDDGADFITAAACFLIRSFFVFTTRTPFALVVTVLMCFVDLVFATTCRAWWRCLPAYTR